MFLTQVYFKYRLINILSIVGCKKYIHLNFPCIHCFSTSVNIYMPLYKGNKIGIIVNSQ